MSIPFYFSIDFLSFMTGDIGDVNYLGPISDQFPKKLTFSEFPREKRENFVIAHINYNHLQLHIKEMRIKFEDSCVNVVGVNETFLRDLLR
jgi:hypothetical protein